MTRLVAIVGSAALAMTACGGKSATTPTRQGAAEPSSTADQLAPRGAGPGPASGAAASAGKPARPIVATGKLPIDRAAAPAPSDFGTAHPFTLRAFDKAERWMALCQARSDTDGDGKIEINFGHHGAVFGDAMSLYLVLGGGAGTPIDAFAGRSADGRWLAILRGDQLELVDSERGDLFAMRDADTQGDGRPGAHHRAATFAGNRLLYIHHRDDGDAVVVHDPETHVERELAMPARIWRIEASGPEVARVYTVPVGEEFPVLQTSLDGGECVGPPMSYGTYGQSGPTPTEHWIALDSGAELPAEGALAAIGATLVRAPLAGGLYLDAVELAPPDCKPQVLALIPAPARVIAICGEKRKAKILLLGKDLRVELESINRDKDHYSDFDRALAPTPDVACDAGLHCIATATNRPIDLRGGVATYASGSKLYVLHATMSSRRHEIVDVVTGTRTPTRGLDEEAHANQFILDYHGNVIDLDTGAILGKAEGALSVSTTGKLLRKASDDGGPLRWAAP